MIEAHLDPPKTAVSITVDGASHLVPVGVTLLEALRRIGQDQPTLCQADNLTPVNTCRVTNKGVSCRTMSPNGIARAMR